MAVIGLAGCVYGYGVSKGTMLQCYLFAFVFWMGLTMGLFGLTLIHHMIRGRWGMPVLRIWEAGSRNLFLMLLFFVPIAYAIYTHHLYPWAFTPDNVPHELQKHIAHKAKYFEFSFFIARAALYFGIWLLFSSVLNRSSVRQDVTGDSEMSNTRASIAAPGVVLFVLTVTFAWTDWVMSLDPSWFSTIFGIWFVVGQGRSATAFTAILIWKWAGTKPYSDMVSEGVTRDIGNVLLTFTMFWGYISISQFLIIYSGNLGEETSYYLRRGLDPKHGASIYWAIGSIITFGQFFVPFVMLLSGKTKRSAKLLGIVASIIFTVRILDIFWTILPFFHGDPRGSGPAVPPEIFWMSLAAWLAMGGIWLFVFVGNLKRYPLLPKHEPRLVEALEHA
jgi:hypothetical protein